MQDQYLNKYLASDVISSLPVKTVITEDIINAFKRLTASRKYNAKQIDQPKSILKQTFDYAIWQKLITVNPVVALPNQTVYLLATRFWQTSIQRVGEWLAITWLILSGQTFGQTNSELIKKRTA